MTKYKEIFIFHIHTEEAFKCDNDNFNVFKSENRLQYNKKNLKLE